MALDTTFFNSPQGPNDLTGTNNRARIGGSAFTVFTWQNSPITFARQVSHQSPAPVGNGTTPIHPLDSPYPVQLITPQALTMGAITLELYELFGSQVWQRLQYLNGDAGVGGAPVDLAGIFQAVANSPNPIHIFRVIRPPRIGGAQMKSYTEEFHNCVVSSLVDGETIEVGTMEVLKQITVNYTHITRGGRNNLLSNSSTLGPTAAAPGTSF